MKKHKFIPWATPKLFGTELKYVKKALNDYRKINFPKTYIWVSHNQIIELINKNLLTIEARNLFACFNIDKIK